MVEETGSEVNNKPRQKLALEFGATDIVEERGDAGVVKIKDLTGGLGAHSVIEAVGTQESMVQAIRSTRPGGHVGYVGVSHDVSLDGTELFFSGVHLHGGPAPVRRFLPELMRLIWDRRISPGKVFDLTLPLDDAAEGYQAMDERHAIRHSSPYETGRWEAPAEPRTSAYPERKVDSWTGRGKSASSSSPIGAASPRSRRAFPAGAGSGACPACAAKRSRCSPG